MTDTNNDLGTAAGKANQIWGELLPVIAFVAVYNLIRLLGIDIETTIGGMNVGINNDTALYWATGVLIILTIGFITRRLMTGGQVPLFTLMSAGIVGAFGIIGIILQDKGFIYAKPTIQQLVLATFIFGSLLFGANIWKVMFKTVFDLPDHAWNVLAIRWGLYFVFMAAGNEFIWRFYVPALEDPLYILGFLWAPAGQYDFLGITFGARTFEDAWATWWKLGTWVITLAFGAANVPYTLKHLRDEDSGALPEAHEPNG
jgi:intracellular septation protein